MMTRYLETLTLAVLTLFVVTALAADLSQAKSEGLVGERVDGYIGLVVQSVPANVVDMVAAVNTKRKTQYQRIATKNGITLEQVQALAGKKAIEKTRSGDWVFLNGGWRRK